MNKIVHVITGLGTGGAEMMLYKLLSTGNPEQHSQIVISLTDIGPVGEKIQAIGVPVFALGMKRGVPGPAAFFNLAKMLRRESPDIVQSWMYHADLIAGIAARLAGGIPVVWGIRNSTLDVASSRKMTIWLVRLCARLSSILPARIVCCSHVAAELHHQLGYTEKKMIVIPNGFDTKRFIPDSGAYHAVRKELAVDTTTILVGLVARFDPQKDHQGFINACRLVHSAYPDVHYLLCGKGINWNNSLLTSWLSEAGLENVFHLLGERDDIPHLTAALDVAVSSSSYGEAFPNVVGEAMACGVPAVVTDVGDSALIVGDTGEVVTPDDPQMLASRLKKLLSLPAESRKRLGLSARQRVEQHYDLPTITARYHHLYEETLSECAV